MFYLHAASSVTMPEIVQWGLMLCSIKLFSFQQGSDAGVARASGTCRCLGSNLTQMCRCSSNYHQLPARLLASRE